MEFDLGLGDLEVFWHLGSFPSHLGSLKWGGDLLSPKIVCPLHGSLFPELMSASVTWNRPFLQPGGGGECLDVSSKLSAFPLRSGPRSRDTLKSDVSEVILKWQVRASRSFLCDCLLPGLALSLDWGSHVTGPLAGWHRGFPAEEEQDAKAALRTPRLCLSAHSLTPKACLHY